MTLPRLVLFAAVVGLFGCGPAAPKLSEIETQIFKPKCATAGCHTGNQPAQGLSLDSPSYAHMVGVDSTLVTTKKLVVAGSSSTSFLYEKISSAMPSSGVQMPNTGVVLSASEQAMIQQWIDAGAQND